MFTMADTVRYYYDLFSVYVDAPVVNFDEISEKHMIQRKHHIRLSRYLYKFPKPIYQVVVNKRQT